MQVAINNDIYKQASAYAEQRGQNLTTVIEDFLVHFIGHSKTAAIQQVSDVVLSLLGAGEPVADSDLNACDAYYQYL